MKFNNKHEAADAISILISTKAKLPVNGEGYISPYICDCIRHVTPIGNEHIGRDLRSWIHELLDQKFSLCEWLKDVHGIEAEEYPTELQKTRQAWLDWMIQEIKTVNKL